MPNELTNTEIIKTLECCIKGDCENCNREWSYNNQWDCMRHIEKLALSLINRQKAENRNLKAHLQQLKARYDNAKAEVERLKKFALVRAFDRFQKEIEAEAYKEFAERLKKKKLHVEDEGQIFKMVHCYEIDNLLKELVGEDNAS